MTAGLAERVRGGGQPVEPPESIEERRLGVVRRIEEALDIKEDPRNPHLVGQIERLFVAASFTESDEFPFLGREDIVLPIPTAELASATNLTSLLPISDRPFVWLKIRARQRDDGDKEPTVVTIARTVVVSLPDQSLSSGYPAIVLGAPKIIHNPYGYFYG